MLSPLHHCSPEISALYSSGAGNHYGTFSGAIAAFSPVIKGRKAAESPGKNFLTNPPKKGSGSGYLHVTIADPPKYMSDAYERARDLRKVCTYSNRGLERLLPNLRHFHFTRH